MNNEEQKKLSLEVVFEQDQSFQDSRFIKLRLRVASDGENSNCFFETSAIQEAKDTLKNIPILARVVFDEDNKPQFAGHDFTTVTDYNNEERRYYLETPIGIVPESSNYEEKKESDGKTYVYCDAYVWKEYSNYAQDVIERDKNIKLSMEINTLSFVKTSNSKKLNVTSFEYKGITLLGNNRNPAIANAMATVGEFEKKDNAQITVQKIADELKDCLEKFSKEGGYQQMDGEKTKEQSPVDGTTNLDDNENSSFEGNQENQQENGEEPKSNGEPEQVKDDGQQDEGGQEPEKENFESTYKTKMDAARNALDDMEVRDQYVYLFDLDNENIYYIVRNFSADTRKIYRSTYTYDEANNVFTLGSEKEEMAKVLMTLAEYETYKQNGVELTRLQNFEAQVQKEKHEAELESTYSLFEAQLADNVEFEEIKKDKTLSCEQVKQSCYSIIGRLEFEKMTNGAEKEKEQEQAQQSIKINFSNDDVDNFDDDGYGGRLSSVYSK